MSNRHLVVGIAVEDEVRIETSYLMETKLSEIVKPAPFPLPMGRRAPAIERIIKPFLASLNNAHPGERVAAVIVSSLGTTDEARQVVKRIGRASWDKEPELPYGQWIRDSGAIGITNDTIIQVVNDATAACLAEITGSKNTDLWGPGATDDDLYAYVRVREGVNVAICEGKKPLQGKLHSEFGHIYTPLHQSDLAIGLMEYGCSKHDACLEGLISNKGFENWYDLLMKRPKGSPKLNALEIIERSVLADDRLVHYVSHCCLALLLLLSPRRIFLDGDVFEQERIDAIRKHLDDELLRGHVEYAALAGKDFLKKATVPAEQASLAGAFEFARNLLFKGKSEGPAAPPEPEATRH